MNAKRRCWSLATLAALHANAVIIAAAAAASASDGAVISLEGETATTSTATIHTEHNKDTCQDDAHCFNGGKCQEPTAITKHRHCHCPPGFSGTKCARFCPFPCRNGGVCEPKVGKQGEDVASHGSSAAYGKSFVNEAKHLDNVHYEYDNDLYRCKCKGLFAGELCEIPYVNCRGKNHRCYHGGECTFDVAANGSEVVGCDCSQGRVGDSCENEVALDEATCFINTQRNDKRW